MTPALRIRSRGPVDDAAQLGRRVRHLAVDGTTQIARRADVPRLVEAGMDSATAAVSDAMGAALNRAALNRAAIDRVAERRRRPTALAPMFVVAVILALGLGAWWFVRSSGSIATLRAISGEDEDIDDELGAAVDNGLDAEALARATDEGMGSAWAAADPPS